MFMLCCDLLSPCRSMAAAAETPRGAAHRAPPAPRSWHPALAPHRCAAAPPTEAETKRPNEEKRRKKTISSSKNGFGNSKKNLQKKRFEDIPVNTHKGARKLQNRKPIGDFGFCESWMAGGNPLMDSKVVGVVCCFCWNGCNGCSGHLSHSCWM